MDWQQIGAHPELPQPALTDMSVQHSQDITRLPAYNLEIRQQPSTTSQSCDFINSKGVLIVPSPVIELITSDPDIMEKPCKYRYFLICWIVEASKTPQSLTSSDQQKVLSGGPVNELLTKQDESGKDVYLFEFTNIRCQDPGAFRLKFSLGKMDPRTAGKPKRSTFLCEKIGQTFIVD
ncbi:Velvet domain superfamily [Fusarium oxysporum f. sp. vasinfectum]|nr:Velvet domain superfamily [Fusarium oxysporum f. sp. vasinfectum]